MYWKMLNNKEEFLHEILIFQIIIVFLFQIYWWNISLFLHAASLHTLVNVDRNRTENLVSVRSTGAGGAAVITRGGQRMYVKIGSKLPLSFLSIMMKHSFSRIKMLNLFKIGKLIILQNFRWCHVRTVSATTPGPAGAAAWPRISRGRRSTGGSGECTAVQCTVLTKPVPAQEEGVGAGQEGVGCRPIWVQQAPGHWGDEAREGASDDWRWLHTSRW